MRIQLRDLKGFGLSLNSSLASFIYNSRALFVVLCPSLYSFLSNSPFLNDQGPVLPPVMQGHFSDSKSEESSSGVPAVSSSHLRSVISTWTF